MGRSDDYVTVAAKLAGRTPKAIFLDVGTGVPRGAWVPRSCIHGGDDRAIDKLALNARVTVRVREWIAEREGLI